MTDNFGINFCVLNGNASCAYRDTFSTMPNNQPSYLLMETRSLFVFLITAIVPSPIYEVASAQNVGRTGIVYFSGGETGAIQPKGRSEDGWGQQAHPNHKSESIQIVSNPTRAGSKSIRLFYDESWGGWGGGGNERIRSELHSPGNMKLKLGEEYWIGFSVFMKNSANNRALIKSRRINAHAVQWHWVNDPGTSGTNMRHGKWQISFGSHRSEIESGPIKLGEWNDFVYHVKLSERSDGFWKVWINKAAGDAPNISKTGMSAKSDLDPKIGVYRGAFDDAAYAEQYYDEYRIGNGSAGFCDVAPGKRARGVNVQSHTKTGIADIPGVER